MKEQNKNSNGVKIGINNQTDDKIDLKLAENVIKIFARVYKINKNKEISLAFVDDAEMKKLNLTYRGLSKATDVLSFSPLNSAEGDLIGQAGDGDYFGEIIIDYSQIKRQAARFNNSAKKEMIFILVHGLLHLLGYNDETEKDREEMIKIGEKFIKKYL